MRKTRTIDIAAEGRDKGKRFIIREMPARQAEKWAFRMLEAIAKSGAEIPEGFAAAGMAGIAAAGARAVFGAPYSLTGPLLDEMFDACISILPDPANPKVIRGAGLLPEMPAVGPLIDDDTEEIGTRLLLRAEVFELHTGFSVAAYLSRIWGLARAAVAQSSDTPMSEPEAVP